jgi:DNA adenine methylase
MTDIQKPFIKWVGGKTQIINDIISRFPTEMNNYHELFLGGGSVLLALLSYQRQGKIRVREAIYAYDINNKLINLFKNVQNNHEQLYGYIKEYVGEYDSIAGNVINRKPNTIEEAKTSKESYYYWMRKKYNQLDIDEHSIEHSALFMIINKTCFRGIYREGPNGYNVPYGHPAKTPQIITLEQLRDISILIKDVKFIHSDFSDAIKNVTEGDFVYLDPPYAPENSTSFVGYSVDGFSLNRHVELFAEIKKLKTKFVMSNAKVALVTEAFKDEGEDGNGCVVYNTIDIKARRAINSKKPESVTTEVIIYN